MKKEYKRDLQNNYLILEAPGEETKESYVLQMAERNQIKNLLQMHSSYRDGTCYLYYEITSRQNLESLYEKRQLGYQDILIILSGIRDALEDMQRYLLLPQHLLFSPEFIYMLPERAGVRFCYYPGEHSCAITLLAEFILKRLDHREEDAVKLGYGLYERVGDENFSLTETLKEMLSSGKEAPGNREMAEPAGLPKDLVSSRERKENLRSSSERFLLDESDLIDPEDENGGIPVEHRERKKRGGSGEREKKKEKEKKKEGTKPEKEGGVFKRIHPGVLFSTLGLVILIELLLLGDWISLTEAGGCFFLLLGLELLLNHLLLGREKPQKTLWAPEEEEEDGEYEKLLEEMYREDNAEEEPAEEIEETRCLVPGETLESLRLIHIPQRGERERYPDIVPDRKPAYVGKASADADVILTAPTVSRLHARVQKRGENCYIQDMNSKNGTFVNGCRLSGQEEYALSPDDEIAFAAVHYRVVAGTGADSGTEGRN